MKRLLLAFSLLAASCGGAQRDDGAAERQVREANAGYDRAIVTGDRAALERILAPDYVYISPEAAVRDRAATIAQLTSGEIRIASPGSEDVQVRWFGDVALITGRFRARVTIGGAEVLLDERYSSLWAHDGENWRLRHEHASAVPQRR